ncbi:relaxase/mobilization nuclease domain-containing protein [Pseudomonas sp. SA3-5]|uniref:Relaxase/mobilization nuclease domain-containing protein n=1 Tax=Pseudomonas aestuarii TaxID=3018340 RepID=A0ABT4XM33_9PSED|nr:relaxase/mobilization nuclease domain-containing protein [Pseudomonas aestuarii]MDA7089281.1 relaxase/mobilization nuclease domain-containing protein [Pseudomonas aestuarii]
MIFKVRKHRSKRHLRNLIRYLLSRQGKSNERVLRHESLNALPMLPGESPISYAKQWSERLWSFTAQERRGKKPPQDYFVHSVMSFFPGNDEHAADQLTAEQAIALAKEAMAEVAPGERQVLYVVHGDKAHLHVHIVFSVVERGGRIWNPRMDFRRWESAAARLEVKYGLYQVTVGRPGGVPARKKSPTSNELNMAIRTRMPSDRMLLQQLLDAALAGKPSFPTFIHRLINAGVTPIPNIASTGRVSGISFRLGDGLPMKGSDLGKGYSWGALSKQLNFAESQHLHLLRPFVEEQPSVDGAVQFDESVEAPALPLSESIPKMRRFIAKPRGDQRIDWVWRNKPTRTAFVESTKVCVARSAHSAVYEAMADRSLQRGLKRVGVTGSEAFRRRMWFELSLRGISAVGYEPSEADRNRLEWWINEQAKSGRGNDSARSPAPSGGTVTGVGREVGLNAANESVNERRAGRDDVSLASGDDLAGAGKSGADERTAHDDAGGNLRNESGDGRVAFVDEGAKKSVLSAEVESAGMSSAIYPTPAMHRASRLGQAALLRQGVQSVQSSDDWRVVMDMLWELNRRFTRWGIVFGMPGQAPLGELTHHAQIAPSWANLQVLNSQGCNIDLQLTSPDSWLHLEGVTALDFERLAAQGVTPTIQFTSGGITQVFVHVNYGCESRQVMNRLAEQIQVGLDARVRAHIGSVSFPLTGFDCWSDEQLRVCSGVSFDGSTMGMQLSSQLRQLKGELDRSGILGAVPVLSLDTMTEAGAELLGENRTVRGEPPRPGEY